MTDKVILPLMDGRWLALSRDDFDKALESGTELVPNQQSFEPDKGPELLTAEQMASRSGIPASWWLESAKAGRVKSFRFGKYVRFPASILTETDAQSVADNGSKPSAARLSAVKD